MSDIVKNQSTGHGYHYASLADFARQKVDIPKMRVLADEFGEFIEYFDGDNWQRGARIVTPTPAVSGKTGAPVMNEAQAYGAGLTYARRYTVAMAQGIATDDDDAVETGDWQPRKVAAQKAVHTVSTTKATISQINFIRDLAGDNLNQVLAKLKAGRAEDLTAKQASDLITALRSAQHRQPDTETPDEPAASDAEPVTIDDIPF